MTHKIVASLIVVISLFLLINCAGTPGYIKESVSQKEQDKRELPKPISGKTAKPLAIGISYSQIMEYLDQFISMSKSSDVRGQTRYMGQTSDNLAMLEIIGNKEDISQATLMFAVPNDAPNILVRNSAMLLRFMKNIAPEWESGSNWSTSALKRVGLTGKPEEIIIGDKSIKLSIIASLGFVSVTVKHKKAI